jgi:hypothetical protein
MSKGSKRRESQIPRDEEEQRWDELDWSNDRPLGWEGVEIPEGEDGNAHRSHSSPVESPKGAQEVPRVG